jgi:hypothetical protein
MEWLSWDGGFEEWFRTVDGWGADAKGFTRHTRMQPSRPAEETALGVLRDLVAWSNGGPPAARKHVRKAAFGLEAIDLYAACLADVGRFPELSPCHDVNPQWSVRASTAKYLEDVAAKRLFDETATQRIRAAARSYRRAYESWRRMNDLVGHGSPAGSARDPQRRARAAEAVREAAEHERAAVAELTEVLETIGAAGRPTGD